MKAKSVDSVIASVLLELTLIVPAPFAAAQRVEIEPNDTPASATLLPLQAVSTAPPALLASMTGAVRPEGDVDYYMFTVPAAPPLGWLGWFQVDTGGDQMPVSNSRNVQLWLLDADGTTILETDDNDGTGNGGDASVETLDAPAIAGVPLAGGTYYLAVAQPDLPGPDTLRIDPYRLYAAVTPAPALPEVEPNGFPALALINLAALPLPFGDAALSVMGTTAGPPPPFVDVPDFYALPAEYGDLLVVYLDCDPGVGASSDFNLMFWDAAAAEPLLTVDSSAAADRAAESFTWRVTAPGIYYVSVGLLSPPAPPDDYVLTVARHSPGRLEFAQPQYCVSEGDAVVILTVNRVGGSYGEVSVDYATSNGSALAGSDYLPSSGTLVFPDGITSATIVLSLLDDAGFEPGESFAVSLSNPGQYGALGVITNATVSLVDDDQPDDNAPATAVPLNVSGGMATQTGALAPAGDLDFYSFTAPAGARVWLVLDTGGEQGLCANSRDSVLSLIGPDGVSTLEWDDNDGSGNAGTSVVFTNGQLSSAIAGRVLPTAGTYYVRVQAAGGTGIIDPYQLTVMLSTNGPVGEVEPNSQPMFAVTLNGAQVVPPNNSPASGSGGFVLHRDNSLSYDIAYGGLTGDFLWPMGAHWHGPAYPSTTGLVLRVLNSVPSGTRAGRLVGGTGPLAPEELAMLRDNMTYVDIHSAAFTNGEIRGQVIFQRAMTASANYLDLSTWPVAVRSGEISDPMEMDDYYFHALPGTEIMVWLDLDPERNEVNSGLTVDLLGGDGDTPLFQASASAIEGTNAVNGHLCEGFTWRVTNSEPELYFLRVRPYPARTGSYHLAVGLKSPGQFVLQAQHQAPCAPVTVVTEAAGSAHLEVLRTFGNDGPATVDFATRDGTARAGSDYVATNGTLHFAHGQTSAGFDVTVLNDMAVELIENVVVALTNATGGTRDAAFLLGACSGPSLPPAPNLGPGVLIVDDDEAPNDTTANAPRMDVSVPVAQLAGSVALAVGDAFDLVGFANAVPGARAWLYARTEDPGLPYSSADSFLSLWRESIGAGNLLEQDDDDGSQGPLSSAIAGRALASAGDYFVAVGVLDPEYYAGKPEQANTNGLPLLNYRLFVALTTNLPMAEREGNNTPATANSIVTSNTPVGLRSGELATAADADVYAIVAEAGDLLLVMLDGNPERDPASCQTDAVLELLEPDGGPRLVANSSGCGGGGITPPAEAFVWVAAVSGTHYVRVSAGGSWLPGSRTYHLMVARDRPFLVTPVIEDGDVTLSFPTLSGRNYQVEGSDNLRDWSPVSPVLPGTGGTVSFTDAGGAGAVRRFYRVVMLP